MMTPSSKTFMMSGLDIKFNQKYIADVLWKLRIAKVSNITLIPYFKHGEIYNTAYVGLHEWCDNEAVYNLITRIKDPTREARLIHNDDDWWVITPNYHNNGKICCGDYTMKFEKLYYEYTPRLAAAGEEDESNFSFALDPRNISNITLRRGQGAM